MVALGKGRKSRASVIPLLSGLLPPRIIPRRGDVAQGIQNQSQYDTVILAPKSVRFIDPVNQAFTTADNNAASLSWSTLTPRIGVALAKPLARPLTSQIAYGYNKIAKEEALREIQVRIISANNCLKRGNVKGAQEALGRRLTAAELAANNVSGQDNASNDTTVTAQQRARFLARVKPYLVADDLGYVMTWVATANALELTNTEQQIFSQVDRQAAVQAWVAQLRRKQAEAGVEAPPPNRPDSSTSSSDYGSFATSDMDEDDPHDSSGEHGSQQATQPPSPSQRTREQRLDDINNMFMNIPAGAQRHRAIHQMFTDVNAADDYENVYPSVRPNPDVDHMYDADIGQEYDAAYPTLTPLDDLDVPTTRGPAGVVESDLLGSIPVTDNNDPNASLPGTAQTVVVQRDEVQDIPSRVHGHVRATNRRTSMPALEPRRRRLSLHAAPGPSHSIDARSIHDVDISYNDLHPEERFAQWRAQRRGSHIPTADMEEYVLNMSPNEREYWEHMTPTQRARSQSRMLGIPYSSSSSSGSSAQSIAQVQYERQRQRQERVARRADRVINIDAPITASVNERQMRNAEQLGLVGQPAASALRQRRARRPYLGRNEVPQQHGMPAGRTRQNTKIRRNSHGNGIRRQRGVLPHRLARQLQILQGEQQAGNNNVAGAIRHLQRQLRRR